MTEDKIARIKVSLVELIELNNIRARHEKLSLSRLDMTLSILIDSFKIDLAKCSVQELEKMQERLRAMLNESEKMEKACVKDKEFVEKLMKRSENGKPIF